MRRPGVRIFVYWNFIIHQNFLEFLQPIQDLRTYTDWIGQQRVARFYRGFLFIWFLGFIGLGFIRLPWSIINRCRHWHWRDVTVSPFSNLTFTYSWWRRGSRRWWRMTLLFHRCPRSWWRSRWRTWQAKNHDRNEVLRIEKLSESRFKWDVVFWPLIHS